MTKAPTTTEADEQAVVVEWLQWRGVMHFSVPNEQKAGPQRLGKLKKMGYLAGAPDLVLVDWAPAVAMGDARPVAVEMKRPGEKPTDTQLGVHDAMRERGWIVLVADSATDCIRQLEGLGY